MKTELKTAGTVVLDRVEVTEAIRSYLRDKHQFDLTKAVYSTKGNTLDGVTIDVIKNESGALGERSQAFVAPAAQTAHLVGKRLKKHQRVNMGIFDNLKNFFELERKKGTKEVKFDELYPLVKVQYPTITEKKLQIYLYDRRQLPKLDFSKVSGVVKVMQ